MAPDHDEIQDRSIKARKHQLYEDDPVLDTGPRRPFKECLRETPADPLSIPIKALLWTLGTVVIILLLAALATIGTKKPKPNHSKMLSPVVASRIG